MLLDYTYGLMNILEFRCSDSNSLFLTESEFKNSNVGGKQLEFIFSSNFMDTMPLVFIDLILKYWWCYVLLK